MVVNQIDENNEKALSHWSKVRNAVLGSEEAQPVNLFNVSGKNKRFKQKYSLLLKHGIKLLYDVDINTHEKTSIKQIIQNKNKQCHIIILDNGNLCILYYDHSQEIFHCKQKIVSLTYADKFNTYVTVCSDNNLRIFSEDLNLINCIPFTGTINHIQYNKFTNEIVTYGKGAITIWLFRTAGTILTPRKVISENIESTNVISTICIEQTSSERQKCFAAVRNTLYIYVLTTGDCVDMLRNIHNSDITQILHFKALQLLATSGKDGSIKIWNKLWNLECIFIGHTSQVTSLSVFPYGPYIISSSLDGTIRTWSLDSKDEMNCQNKEMEILGLKSELGDNQIFSFTEDSILKWEVHNLHSPFTILGSKAISIKCTTNHLLPLVCYCICDDTCVRIFCPSSGEIITVFISPGSHFIIDATYHVADNLLFVLLKNGTIVKASTTTNPCTILQTWTEETTNAPSVCTCLTVYEYIAKDLESEDAWGNVIEKAKHQQILMGAQFKKITNAKGNKQTTLLIGGCTDGSLTIFDWLDIAKHGKTAFTLKAHRDEVCALAVNPKLNQLASSSKDKSLKVWRVFPFAEEALTPLLLFINSDVVHHLMFSNFVIAAVIQDTSKATHTLAVYKTKDSKKAMLLSHGIADDHADNILSLTTCSKLRLIATSSMDRTIRIWNTENKLIRVLQLNDVAHTISFCSLRGDLLLGIGKNIHHIQHIKYLPESYQYQMIAMEFKKVCSIPPIPVDTNLLLEAKDQSRLSQARSSYMKFMKFVDELPKEEQERRDEDYVEKNKGYALLEERDKELLLIKDGKLKPKKTSKMSKSQKDISFTKYLSLFYDKPNVQYPNDDEDSHVEDDEEKFFVKIDDSFKPSPQADEGFFAINIVKGDMQKIKEDLKRKREEGIKKRNKILHGDSVEAETMLCRENRSLSMTSSEPKIPKLPKHPKSASSTYVERLKGMKDVPLIERHKDVDVKSEKVAVIEVTAKSEYPSNEQAIRNVSQKVVKKYDQPHNDVIEKKANIPIAPDGYLPNSVIVALYKELRREITEEEKCEKWKPRGLTAMQLDEINKLKAKTSLVVEASMLKLPPVENVPSKIMEKFQEAQSEMKQCDEDTEDLSTPPESPIPSPSPELVIKPKSPPKINIKIIKPKKPIVKLKPKEPKVPDVTPVLVIPPVVRPPSPLPPYIEQFKECDWFKQLFPDATKKAFGGDVNVDDFIKILLEHLAKMNDYKMKSNLIMAILLLLNQEGFMKTTCTLLHNKILAQLNNSAGAPTSKSSEEERNFIRKCLHLLLELKDITQMVIVELMAQYILAAPRFRMEIANTFSELGVIDSKGYFIQELCTAFDVTEYEASQRKQQLSDLCFDWLSKWLKLLRQHITSLAGKICRASSGQVVKGTASKENIKSILKKDTKNKNKKGNEKTQDKAIAFVPDKFVSEAASHVTPIEAINYFCEMKFEEELAKFKTEEVKPEKKSEEKKDKTRNTVLLLPKINNFVSLARIGETHQSICHPERETSLAKDFILPSINGKNGIHSLLLHINTLTLNPFPEEVDQLLYSPTVNADLITLRSTQKYFIPSRSVVM